MPKITRGRLFGNTILDALIISILTIVVGTLSFSLFSKSMVNSSNFSDFVAVFFLSSLFSIPAFIVGLLLIFTIRLYNNANLLSYMTVGLIAPGSNIFLLIILFGIDENFLLQLLPFVICSIIITAGVGLVTDGLRAKKDEPIDTELIDNF